MATRIEATETRGVAWQRIRLEAGQIVRRLRRRIARLTRRLAEAREAGSAAAELRALGEHELHDIGLGHGGIEYAARHGRGWARRRGLR